MKCHAYCILYDQDRVRSALPLGPDGGPLALVSEEGLACVYARVTDDVLTTAVPQLLAYAHVIENLAQHFPLLPMRYGSVLDSEDELRDWLRKRQPSFRECLEKLEGCGEMSIRVLPESSDDRHDPDLVSEPQAENGIGYLATRRTKYQAGEHQRQQATRLCDEIRAQFQSLFRDSRTEQTIVTGRFLVSLHFLVPKAQIESFRITFHQLHQMTSHKVLLSGPWPPYNFAVCD